MNKLKKDEDLMKKMESIIKSFEPDHCDDKDKATVQIISSGDKVFDKAVGNALKKGKPNK